MFVILGHPFYLHELLEDSSLHLPEVVKPPRVSGCIKKQSLLFWNVYKMIFSSVRTDRSSIADYVIMKPNVYVLF